MSFIQNLFSSRDNNANTQTYVGQTDRIWYNPDNNTFRVSDGTSPGGLPIDYSSGANITANNVTANNLAVNTISNDDSTEVKFTSDVTFDDEVSVNGNLTIVGNISPASNTKIGGVRAGPGANISNTGLLTIDTTGLPLSFGNFTANNNILTIVNADEDMILATQGDAEIQLVGNIGFYKSNGLPPDPANRYFFAKDDGQIFFYISDQDPLEAAIDIVGTTSGNVIPPGITGAMLQVTGQRSVPCRIYYDGNDNYVSWVARRYNGNVDAPTQVLADQDVLRINATAATDLGGGNVGNVAMAQIRMTALENQTPTAQGSSITFTVTPVGQPVANRVDVANVTVADGVTATKFTTAGTVSATGNITGGNLITGGVVSATGNITGGNLAGTAITGTLSTAAQPNVTSVGTLTSLTVTGNVSGGNLTTGAQVVATGNITGANITATANIADSKGDVRSIPVNTQNTGYTLVAADAGKVINMTTGNVTVPAGVFASPFGQAITIYNDQNASNAVVSGAGVTLRLAGTAATGNRTLARYGLATVVCVSANTFVISGAGLT